MPDYEEVAGVEPIAEVGAAIEKLAAENAAGYALYGPGGLFNDQRKALLSVVALRVRGEIDKAGQKATEPMIDALAHADAQYRAFLDRHEKARADWYVADSKLTTMHQRVARGNRVLDFAARIG